MEEDLHKPSLKGEKCMTAKGKSDNGGKEELNKTLKRLDAEIEKTPNDIGLYHIKVALLSESGLIDETLEQMDNIIEIDPCDTKIWHDKGEILFDMGRYKDALECYNKAVEIDHDLTKSWLGRGITLIKLRNLEFEDDLEILDKERRVQLEDALDSLTVVTDRNPKSLPAWNGKGYVLYTLHRYDEALECFDKCIKINSDFIKAWYGRGKVLKTMERQLESIQSFQTAVGCIGNNVVIKDIDTLICKANSYLELGQNTEAVDCINRFLERDPHNPIALAGKGDILERIGRQAEALQCYKKSVELDSKRAYIWHKIGNLKNERGEFETALDCYNEAVQLIPGFEEAWFKIGELLTIENKDDQAKECFGWVLEINPDNVKAQKAMSTFEHQKELLGSLFKRGRRKHKDGKKRKKRKRKKSKEQKINEAPSDEVSYEDQYQEPQPELIYEEEMPGEIQEDYKYQEPDPGKNYYDETVTPGDYGYEEHSSETENYEDPKLREYQEEEGVLQQPYESEEIQGGSPSQEHSENDYDYEIQSNENEHIQNLHINEDSNEEMSQSLESLEEGAGELDPSSIEEEVSEIESELLKLESESHDEDSMEDVDSGLNELQDLLDDDPEKSEMLNEDGILAENQDQVEHSEEEPGEVEPESYGDLGDNLNELERLLVEKADHVEASGEEEAQSEEASLDNNESVESEQEEPTPGLEDLEANLDELQDLLVTDSAHLDGQKVNIKPSGEAHLDGHQIQDQGELIGMDAHSSDYEPSQNIKESLETLMSRGKKHMERREFKQAMNCFDMALELDPQYVDAWGAKGDLLLEMDKEEEE
jgi:tetratricopeptide (TPR) repeat protein